MSGKKISDVSDELLIQPSQGGIELIKTPSSNYNAQNSIANIFKLPFCVYFLNTQSVNQKLNEEAVDACGYTSLTKAIGKSISDVVEPESAKRVVRYHQDVMHSHQLKIFEEDLQRKNDLNFQCLTILLPWHNQHALLGVLGFSIIIGKHSLSDSLLKLSHLGLLQPNSKLVLPGAMVDQYFLSQREHECLKYFASGKTIKQIAQFLKLSPRTVEHYIENVKNKMGVSTKTELAIKYLKNYPTG